MPNVEDKVCPNHPEVAAVSRCASCFKPLCSDCIIKQGSNDFCSDQCASNFSATNKHFNALNEREKARKFRARIKKILMAIIFLCIVAFTYKYWSENKEKIDKKLKSKSEQLIKELKKK